VQELEVFWSYLITHVFPIEPEPFNLFNPYNAKVDLQYDLPNAHLIRRRNLWNYFNSLENKPDLLLIGEAPGYQGVRFSGVPFTSERQLCDCELRFAGQQSGRDRLHWTPTSNKFWKVMLPYHERFLAWNSIPFHPWRDNPLSNRPPRLAELRAYADILQKLWETLKPEKIVAVGNKAERALRDLNIDYAKVTHPAARGKHVGKFEKEILEIIGSCKT
jgi:uracil-DNA glycosylase